MNATANRLADLLADCRDDPDLFNTAVLNRPPLHVLQREWARALVEYRVTAIETGNALGKDYFVGGVVPWWLYTRPNSLVIVTGPSQTLLGSVTWKEVRRAVEGSPVFKAGLLKGKLSEGIKSSPHTLIVQSGWQALAFSTTSVERASGQHAGQLLVIVEEASGVEPMVWEAIDGLKFRKLLVIGNPLRASGGFVDLCNRGLADAKAGVPKREAVCYLNTPSTASPDADLEQSEVGLADRTWLRAMARQYGVDSLWYRAHVLAIRPTESHEVLIKPEWLSRAVSDHAERAAAEYRRAGRAGRRRLSCDVGEGVGNARSVVVVRDDVGILELVATAFSGPSAVAEVMADLCHRWRVAPEDASYDGAGTTGKRLGNALPGVGLVEVRPFFGSGKGGRRFANARSAAAAAFARRLDPDGFGPGGDREIRPFHLPNHPDLATITEELRELRGTLKGDKYALEDKQSMMERLGRSPDFCDAITQSFRDEAAVG